MEKFSCVKECMGCAHVFGSVKEMKEGTLCGMYQRPAAKWTKLGGCEGRTHNKTQADVEAKVRVGQQKQKKGSK